MIDEHDADGLSATQGSQNSGNPKSEVTDTPVEKAEEVVVTKTATDEPDGAEDNQPDAGVSESDTFDRSYVEDLRKESAGYRTQAKALAARLHTELVRQTGLLADPADLPFDPGHLDDPDALTAAVEALIAEKPHLKARRFAPGAAAQGPKNQGAGTVDLLGMLQQRI